jgi:integrase/recombinase XerD
MNFQEQLFHDFEQMMEFRESVGYATSTYRSSLLPFIKFCGENYPNSTVISREMVDNWLEINNFRKINTQSVFISMLRQYTKFIKMLGRDAFVPDEDYNLKKEKYIPYKFTGHELATLFDAFDKEIPRTKKYRHNVVLPVLFRMMYCCGMRPSEPLHLRTEDVNLETGDIFIRETKRHKDRHIIMSEEMRQLCIHYDSLSGSREWFFQKWDGTPYDRGWMTSQFHQYWKKSGLIKRGNPRPYDLRHAFVSRNIIRWIDEGKDVMSLMPYLSVYLGHAGLESTFYYIHLLPECLLNSSGIDWHQFDMIYGEDFYHES